MKYKGCALMLLRIAVGVVFVYHGWSKFSNMEGTIMFFSGIGLSSFWAYVATYVELLGGIAILVGFNTRIAAMLGAVIMLVAIAKVHWPHGFNGAAGGYEYQFVLLLNFIALAIMGGGRHSVDAMYGTCMIGNKCDMGDNNCCDKKGKNCECC